MPNRQLSFREIVNIDELKTLFETFSDATGFTTGLVDQTANEILIATGWRDICVKFHRANSDSVKHCKSSGRILTVGLETSGEIRICHCQNGLVDGCTPIIIEGRHLANLATGQIFFAPPNIDRFKEQASQYGYDEQAYLEAISKVPVVDEKHFKAMLLFLSRLATTVAEIGLSNLQSQRDHSEIANNKTLLDSMINSIPDLIFYKDQESKYLGCNKAFTEYSGCEEKDIVGKTDFDIFPKEIAPFFQDQDRQVLASGKAKRNTEVLTHPKGKKVPVDTLKTPYIGPDGNILGIIGIVRNITERKKAEDERLKLETQLQQAHKMEAIGTLAGGIAHDFNNILTAIFGYTELAMLHLDNKEKLQDDLDEVREGATRAKELVQQILTFSRKSEQTKKPLQMALIVKEVIKLLRSSIPSTIAIKQQVEADEQTVLADPTQIHQILMNLSTNAYHAMRDNGGTLSISLREKTLNAGDPVLDKGLPPGRYLDLEVLDTGAGMDHKTLDKIFEPYFTTKDVGDGTGLGLAVVHGIVKDHQGIIHVDSELNHGTSFRVYLPIIENEPTTQEENNVVAKDERCGTGQHILYVDDEITIINIAQEILTSYGYKITTCADPEQALTLFTDSPSSYDLLITDMTMPKMTGTELAEQVKAIRPEIPMLLCTGHSDLINKKSALALGFKEYISKPMVMSKLIHSIKKALQTESQHD